jgi:dihydrolipoamide dehydrogenase
MHTVETIHVPEVIEAEVLVIGAGPGGYTAAFRAADLGLKVVLVDKGVALGGTCLNVGCIPSKALLHAAKVITEAEEMTAHGIKFVKPEIDLDELRKWKSDSIVDQLSGGLDQLAKQRNVQVIQGKGTFISAHEMRVQFSDAPSQVVRFDHAIIAVGSSPASFPNAPIDPRIMNSSDALAIQDIPERLLVIGGGIIGLELGTVYEAFGSKVTIAERSPTLMKGSDKDVIRPLHRRMAKRFEKIMVNTVVDKMAPMEDGIHVDFSGENSIQDEVFDRVLVAIGRKPNGHLVGAEHAGIYVDEKGYIPVDKSMRTNVPHIFAIGDVIGNPMLAHKATHQGKVAAEVIAGHAAEFSATVIPSVAYTDPEIAWAGITENDAKERGLAVQVSAFPWAASGRALSINRTEGLTKLIFDKYTNQLIGAAIVGTNAGELITEAVLAIETATKAEELGQVIHPHPTLSETICFAAEMNLGTITDLYVKKQNKAA